MAIYAIGDLQGCYDPFRRLLDAIEFDPHEDTLWLAGGRDRLVPPAAVKRAAERVQQGQFQRLRGAGHAPFIGHREPFVQAIKTFLGEATCH